MEYSPLSPEESAAFSLPGFDESLLRLQNLSVLRAVRRMRNHLSGFCRRGGGRIGSRETGRCGDGLKPLLRDQIGR